MSTLTANPGLAPRSTFGQVDLGQYWPLQLAILITIILFVLTIARIGGDRILPLGELEALLLSWALTVAIVVQGVVLVVLAGNGFDAERKAYRAAADDYRTTVQHWLLADYGIVASDASVKRLGQGESIVLQVPTDVGSSAKTPLEIVLLPADDGIAIREVDGAVLVPINTRTSDQKRDSNG